MIYVTNDTFLQSPMISPAFHDDDKENDINALNQMKNIPKVAILSEWHVTRALLVHLVLIGRFVVLLPMSLLKFAKTPEYKHNFAIFASMVISFAGLHYIGVDFEWGFTLMKTQTIYKLWAVYTLLMIVLKYAFRVHRFTHLIIRGAIREGRSLILPIFWHSVSNALLFVCYSISNGTYLAGLFGKSTLFFSACIHIQAVIAKKYLPKILEQAPAVAETTRRVLMIIAIVFHLSYGEFSKITMMIGFEYGCAFARYFLTAMCEDSEKFWLAVKDGASNAIWEFKHNDAKFDDSLLVNVPSEIFAMCVVSMALMGPEFNRICIMGGCIALALVGTLIIKLIPMKEKPPAVVLESKKDKGGKKDGKDKKDEKDEKEEDKKKDEKKEDKEDKKNK